MNTGTERDAIESIYGYLRSVTLEGGQRFVDESGTELHLAGVSRANICGDRSGDVAVFSVSGLKRGIDRPNFRIRRFAGMVVIRPQTEAERKAEGIGAGLAPRYVASVVEPSSKVDGQGRFELRLTGAAVSYPLLISAGVKD